MSTLSNELRQRIDKAITCDIGCGHDTGYEACYEHQIDRLVKLFATQNTALLKEVANTVIGADETSLGCEVCDSFMTGEHDPWNCQPDNYCPNCKHHYDGKCTNKSGISRVEIEPRNTLRAEQRSKLAAMGGQ